MLLVLMGGGATLGLPLDPGKLNGDFAFACGCAGAENALFGAIAMIIPSLIKELLALILEVLYL
jgi:hypothetical protein